MEADEGFGGCHLELLPCGGFGFFRNLDGTRECPEQVLPPAHKDHGEWPRILATNQISLPFSPLPLARASSHPLSPPRRHPTIPPPQRSSLR